MTYKLSPRLSLIDSPVVLVVDGTEKIYSSGDELTQLTFEQNYVVESISARDGSVFVRLKRNARNFNLNWAGEEAVSFM